MHTYSEVNEFQKTGLIWATVISRNFIHLFVYKYETYVKYWVVANGTNWPPLEDASLMSHNT